MTLRWTLTQHMLMSHVQLYTMIIVSNSHGDTTKYVDTVTIFQKPNQKVSDPKMTFDPTSIEVTWVTLPKDQCIQVPWKYVKVCGYTDPSKKKKRDPWTKGHWPLDDLWLQVCWSHMCDSTQGSSHPSPMKIHQSIWIQWLLFCKNLNQRSLIPRWPLTPCLLRSVTCVTLPKDHYAQVPWESNNVCAWIQWSILHTTTYILHTDILRTEWVIT